MVYKHAVAAAFHIYAQPGEVAAKRGGWSLCIKKSWKLNCSSWKNHGIMFLNFCGNPVIKGLHYTYHFYTKYKPFSF